MTLFWFILGTALVFAIARYNESNKLFWTLFVSFIMGFAVTKMVYEHHEGEEQNNVSLTQANPTQMSATAYNAQTLYEYVAVATPKKVTALNSVSQDMPEARETEVILSEVSTKTRDQPLPTITNPPELCLLKDTSTHHESG